MRRREILKKSAGVLAASTLFTGVSAARKNGEIPNENVDRTHIHQFADEPIEVKAGEWLRYRWGWIDSEGEESTKEAVQRWLDTTRVEVYVDGEAIENPEQYWSDIYLHEDREQWAVAWECNKPPKSPGLYTFKVKTIYEETFEDGESKWPAGTYTNQSQFRVVPRRGKKEEK